jgi:hypothetical protein
LQGDKVVLELRVHLDQPAQLALSEQPVLSVLLVPPVEVDHKVQAEQLAQLVWMERLE